MCSPYSRYESIYRVWFLYSVNKFPRTSAGDVGNKLSRLASVDLVSKCFMWVHAQSCLTLCDTMDCSLPSSSVHGILWAWILEWVAMPSSRWFSQPRNQTPVSCSSCIGRQILYHCTTWNAKGSEKWRCLD